MTSHKKGLPQLACMRWSHGLNWWSVQGMMCRLELGVRINHVHSIIIMFKFLCHVKVTYIFEEDKNI